MKKESFREEEINRCFEENEGLLHMSPKRLATYFFIQGELCNSHTREVLSQKANYYRNRLGALSREGQKEADDQWKRELQGTDEE